MLTECHALNRQLFNFQRQTFNDTPGFTRCTQYLHGQHYYNFPQQIRTFDVKLLDGWNSGMYIIHDVHTRRYTHDIHTMYTMYMMYILYLRQEATSALLPVSMNFRGTDIEIVSNQSENTILIL